MVPRAATQRGIMVISVDILGLPFFKSVSVSETKDSILINAEVVFYEAEACPFCQGTEQVRFGSKRQAFIDAPIRGKHVTVSIERQRFRCKGCGRTHSEYLPHLDDKRSMTERCLEYIQGQSLRLPFVQVAEDVGISEGTIRRVFGEFTARLEKDRKVETPEWLGLDELKLCGEMRCILTDVQHRKVMDLLPKRDLKTLTHYLRSITDPERVQLVTMDMWKPYKDIARLVFPDARVIVDKFHIVRMANYCLDVVRKDARGDLTPGKRKSIMRSRFLLFKRQIDLTDEERLKLDMWCCHIPLLREAYDLKEGFYQIWDDSKNSVDAYAIYAEWEANMSSEMVPFWKPLTTAVGNWHEQIFGYFDTPATNAYTECANGIIKVANRTGRGYSFDVIRAKILYAQERGDDMDRFESVLQDMSSEDQFRTKVLMREQGRRALSTHKVHARKLRNPPKVSSQQL